MRDIGRPSTCYYVLSTIRYAVHNTLLPTLLDFDASCSYPRRGRSRVLARYWALVYLMVDFTSTDTISSGSKRDHGSLLNVELSEGLLTPHRVRLLKTLPQPTCFVQA
jgi:hypothetical protein